MSVPEVRQKLEAAVLADTRSHTLTGVPTATTLPLGAGDGASWAKSDLLWIGEPTTPLLHNATTIVQSISVDTLTVWPDLPSAPAAGSSVNGGAREWLRYIDTTETGFNYFRDLEAADVPKLLENAVDSRVVIGHGDPDHTPELFSRVASVWLWMLWGRDAAWLEGLSRRIFRLFDRKPDDLVVPGRKVWELNVDASELGRSRWPEIHERRITLSASTSRAF